MKRRRGSGRFRRENISEEEINPMDGIANLVDVMLVFACGLMLALITYWNLDVAGTMENPIDVEQGQEVSDMSNLDGETGEPLSDASLQQYGTVYIDPATGKMYMVTEDN
jgi:hypothetical protein